jgi:inosine-uridine nucleoside N-ribohydrolase
MRTLALSICLVLSSLLPCPVLAQAPAIEKKPILLDTDIGSGIDDAFALALILASPELELRGVTSVSGNTQQRAMMLCRFLTMTGRRHTAVAVGADPQPKQEIRGQYQYYYHPDVLFNRTTKPVKESAVEFLHARLKGQPGKVTIVACGPLTNIARLMREKPDCKPLIRSIIVTGGNLPADAEAARTVFSSGVPLVLIPADATAELKLPEADVKRIFAPCTALSLQVQALYQLWDGKEPPLADALAAALCVDEGFATLKEANIEIDDKGAAHTGGGKANARVVTAVARDRFIKWYVDRMASCVRPSDRPVTFVPRGNMPHRVHVAEDYDLDIERRWWMSGKAETKNLPPGSTRACRGVLTHDFDDLLGDPKAMYTAVIFNPVPGPPMGKNTRLSFRYWLKGTDTLRVQIYSLSNGHHRQLVLKNLPQERWEAGTVAMTQARRPDGTGGPLSENERIDDIQFYTDPRAELIIDDIVLYDAAVAGEKRPFPKKIHFTAWFDSGKQGKEWPGTFEIVPQKGFFWHAAKSVENQELGASWIRLHLRGERILGENTQLSFRYRLTGADSMQVALVNRTARAQQTVELTKLTQDQWTEHTVDFARAKPAGPAKGDRVDEILFILPKRAELLLDDVLLFEKEN